MRQYDVYHCNNPSIAGLYKETDAPQGTGSATDVMAPAKLNIINQGMDTRAGYGLETGLSIRFSPHYIQEPIRERSV